MNCRINSDTPTKKKIVPRRARRRRGGGNDSKILALVGKAKKQSIAINQQISGDHANMLFTIAPW